MEYVAGKTAGTHLGSLEASSARGHTSEATHVLEVADSAIGTGCHALPVEGEEPTAATGAIAHPTRARAAGRLALIAVVVAGHGKTASWA